MINIFGRYAKIENTRMIFDFMQELDHRCTKTTDLQYCGDGGLNERFNIIDNLSIEIKGLIEESRSDSNGDFLYQNPLTQYITFWNKMYKHYTINFTDNKKAYLNILANMLNYFRCIKCLDDRSKGNIKNDDLPYIYEDICLSICGITCSDMCYILCQDANSSIQTIMTSSYSIDDLSNTYLNINADKLIEKVCTTENEKIDGIYYFTEGEEATNIKGSYIVISMPEHYYKNETNRKFYIVLQKKKVVNYSNDIINTLSMILFLRERFLNVLKRDFAVLLNLRFDVSYIKPINNDPKRELFILHLSDLHITENKKWDINSKTVTEIIKGIGELTCPHKIDLIAITGDIVQASNNANSAQEKYMKAENIIREIAVKLWGINVNKEDITSLLLPHDWKRRILITTGNHDYAAMNDVMVQTKSRVIKSALPSQNQGGTMSKFTYYIEFMQHFLDAPIDKLILNDLNEVRFYRNLNLDVLILNSVSLANSLQNNKVGFNEAKVEMLKERFLKETDRSSRRICLSHHSPNYIINYVDDIYSPYKFFNKKECEKTSVEKMYECFCECLKEIRISESINFGSDFIKNFKTAFDEFEEMITEYQNKGELSKIKEIVENSNCKEKSSRKEIDLWIKNFYESDFYSDTRGLYNFICNGLKNEFSMQLLNKLYNMNQMQCYDKENFRNIYEKILNNEKSIAIHAVFSGHEHKRNDDNIESCGVRLYIEGKFEKDYSVITIDDRGKSKRHSTQQKNKTFYKN